MTLFIIPELELNNGNYLYCKVRRNQILIMALPFQTDSDCISLLIPTGLQEIAPELSLILYGRKEPCYVIKKKIQK